MRAVVIEKHGGYSELKIKKISLDQKIGETEVLVKVSNIGVNYADCLVRLGLYKSASDNPQYRGTPGFDFSGIVESVGKGVTGLKKRDRVFGVTLFGAYQTEIVVDQKYMYVVPEQISLALAASIPTTFLTAHHILFNLALIKENETLLVRSIAGGVGSWLSILGTRAGANVYGTVSTDGKKEIVQKNGIYNVEISDGDEFRDLHFDVIANAYGGETIKKDFSKLNPQGRLILYGFHGMISTTQEGRLSLLSWLKIFYKVFFMHKIHPFVLVNQNKSVIGCNLSYLFSQTDLYQNSMSELISILNERSIELPQVMEIKFEEVAKAHYLLEHKKTIGKLVLKVD